MLLKSYQQADKKSTSFEMLFKPIKSALFRNEPTKKLSEILSIALTAAIPQMYDSQSITTTFIIDAKDDLAFAHKGMADYNRVDFKEFLKSL